MMAGDHAGFDRRVVGQVQPGQQVRGRAIEAAHRLVAAANRARLPGSPWQPATQLVVDPPRLVARCQHVQAAGLDYFLGLLAGFLFDDGQFGCQAASCFPSGVSDPGRVRCGNDR